MAKIRYEFHEGAPGSEPGLYKTCLKSERDISIRWWDGALWWDISPDRGRAELPFKWPKGKAKRGITMPSWWASFGYEKSLCLRKITDQKRVRWGVAYTHYEPAEVLAYLVKQGKLPKDWRDYYQEEMRDQKKGDEGRRAAMRRAVTKAAATRTQLKSVV